MKKQTIKVVKKDQPLPPEKQPSAEEIRTIEERASVEDHRNMSDTVKNWIAERRENKDAEDQSDVSQLYSWNPPTKTK
jgi:hypothetical protein